MLHFAHPGYIDSLKRTMRARAVFQIFSSATFAFRFSMNEVWFLPTGIFLPDLFLTNVSLFKLLWRSEKNLNVKLMWIHQKDNDIHWYIWCIPHAFEA